MIKNIFLVMALSLVLLSNSDSGQGKELTSDVLMSVLKKLGIYANNVVSIGGQNYVIENVFVSSSRREQVIRFVAKPTE